MTGNLILSDLNIMEVSINEYFDNNVQVIQLKEKIQEAVGEAKDITVFTPESLDKAAHYIKQFKSLEKELDNTRTYMKKPILDKGKEIDSFFKSLTLLFATEQKRLESEALDWKRKQEMEAKRKAEVERKRLEEEALKQALIKEEELKKIAKENGQDPNKVRVEVPIIPEIIQEDVKLSQKNSQGIGTVRRREWDVTDLSLVPREFLMVDPEKMKAERAKYDFEALSPIPGIRFFFTESIRG